MSIRIRSTFATASAVGCLCLGLVACGSDASTDAGSDLPTEGDHDVPEVSQVASVVKSVPEPIRRNGVLRVTMSTSSPPAHFTTDDGMVGADVDLAEVLGKTMDLEVEVTGAPLEQILPGLQADRYDAVVSQFSPTADRAKVLDFVDYARSGTSLGVPRDNPGDLAPDTLCGSDMGVQKGSSQAAETVPALSKECESDGEEPITISTFPESTAAVLALKSNRVDGILLDSPVLGYAAKKSAGAIEVAGTIATQPVAIGVPKGSGMTKPIQQALVELDRDGVLKKVFEEWGMDDSVIHDFAINKIVEG